MDADYARNKRGNGEAFDTFEHALFVYATVMSAPTLERLIVDAGLKALSVDSGMPVPWHLTRRGVSPPLRRARYRRCLLLRRAAEAR
jgi:D-serine deaminase-like pyridoxal phosphate-dependent protein